MLTVTVSYTVTTPESAEFGDYAETGLLTRLVSAFVWPTPVDALDLNSDEGEERMSGRDALRLIRDKHCCYSVSVCGDSASFYSSEPQIERYTSGEREEHVVHVRGDARLIRALVRASKARRYG